MTEKSNFEDELQAARQELLAQQKTKEGEIAGTLFAEKYAKRIVPELVDYLKEIRQVSRNLFYVELDTAMLPRDDYEGPLFFYTNLLASPLGANGNPASGTFIRVEIYKRYEQEAHYALIRDGEDHNIQYTLQEVGPYLLRKALEQGYIAPEPGASTEKPAAQPAPAPS